MEVLENKKEIIDVLATIILSDILIDYIDKIVDNNKLYNKKLKYLGNNFKKELDKNVDTIIDTTNTLDEFVEMKKIIKQNFQILMKDFVENM